MPVMEGKALRGVRQGGGERAEDGPRMPDTAETR